MPTPGPVAYHPHEGFLTSLVISTGSDHVLPSSVLLQTHMVLVLFALFSLISDSRSSPRLCVNNIHIVPVFSSTTGQGLPHVLSPSFQTTCRAPQVLPPSSERFSTRSMFPESD